MSCPSCWRLNFEWKKMKTQAVAIEKSLEEISNFCGIDWGCLDEMRPPYVQKMNDIISAEEKYKRCLRREKNKEIYTNSS